VAVVVLVDLGLALLVKVLVVGVRQKVLYL
jgi:hypothetical protein